MDSAFRTLVTVASIVGDTGNSIAKSAPSFPTVPVPCDIAPQDATLSFLHLAQKYGHPATQYNTITEDGYNLTVFRMKSAAPKPNALPILLVHGVLDSSDTWILRGDRSLSITLAREGYDVWAGNIRGNMYSQGHISPAVEADPNKYWNFTFNEHGKYDLSAMINLVLVNTGSKKLNAFAHSQGTTMFFVLCSTRPEYNAKINVVTTLAPVAYLQNTPPPVSTLIQFSPIIYTLGRALNVNEVLGPDSIIVKGLKLICSLPLVGYTTCALSIFFPVVGYDPVEFDECFLRVEIGHYPQPTPLRNLYHFAQVGFRKQFAQYDYGEAGNLAEYNSIAPPVYDLSKVTTKVVLLAGTNDHLSTIADVAILRTQLANVVYRVVPRSLCNHFDHVVGLNMPDYLFPDIFDVLRLYGNS